MVQTAGFVVSDVLGRGTRVLVVWAVLSFVCTQACGCAVVGNLYGSSIPKYTYVSDPDTLKVGTEVRLQRERSDGEVQKLDGTKVQPVPGSTRCIAVRSTHAIRCIPIEQVRRAGYRDGSYATEGTLIGLGADAIVVGIVIGSLVGFIGAVRKLPLGPELRFRGAE